jgi:D-amino-acid dehydrogenase
LVVQETKSIQMKTTIIGGGIIGLTCAWYLQEQGFEVSVIDKGNMNEGCSFGNAGYVSPSHFIPLASPGIVAKGLRWMLSSTSPFYIKPRLNADLIRWCYTFWRRANQKTVERNAPHLNNILQLSRTLMNEMNQVLGNSFDMEEKGCFMLYKTDKTAAHEMELAAEAAHFGIETRILNAAEVQALEPMVEVTVKGGVLYPIDAHLNPGKWMAALKTALLQKGVQLIGNTNVTGFEKQGRRVTAVLTDKGSYATGELVIATGAWLPLVTEQLGIRLLLQPGKGYSMTYNELSQNLQHPAILVDDRVAMTPMRNSLRIGGTMELSGINNKVLVKRAEAVFNAVKKYYPGLPLSFPSTDKIWNGMRPCTPDGLPYIGRHRSLDNLTIAGGHAMLGISLAAGTGKLVSELLAGHPLSIPVQAFDVHR